MKANVQLSDFSKQTIERIRAVLYCQMLFTERVSKHN